MTTSSEILVSENVVLLPPSDKDRQTVLYGEVLRLLLADKRSENTRRAYSHDLKAFFRSAYCGEPTPEHLRSFLTLDTPQMAARILQYRAFLIGEKYAEATVNRRLAAIMSLVKYARRVGATQADPGEHIEGERVVSYRDTRGISTEQARLLLKQPDRTTRKGKRDFALLHLLLENALRRAEIVSLTLADFHSEEHALTILGKGRGTQKERVTLSTSAVTAISEYLASRAPSENSEVPLFCNVSPACYGKPLTADGLYKIVREMAEKSGFTYRLSPHRLRHTAITMALNVSGGDIRRVQRLSRHARLETLQIYDDNRTDLQGEMTGVLSGILHAE